MLTSSINTPSLNGPNMYIDRVVHKAVLNVTEPFATAVIEPCKLIWNSSLINGV